MSTPDPALQAALAELARTDTLLVALDFDGTLSPLVEHADDARPLPEYVWFNFP